MNDERGDGTEQEGNTGLDSFLPTDVVQPGRTLATGIGSFVAGYLSLFALLAVLGRIDFSLGSLRAVKGVGHAFYNALNIPTYTRQTSLLTANGTEVGAIVKEGWQNSVTGYSKIHRVTRMSGEVTNETTVTGVGGTDPSIPALVYLLVPVVVLVVVGVVYGYRVRTSEDTSVTRVSLYAGALLTLGFLLVALLGTYALTETGTQTVLRPARLETFLYGFAYPAAFGTGGVAVGQLLRRRNGESTADSESDAGTE